MKLIEKMNLKAIFYLSILFNIGCKSQVTADDDGITIILGGREIPNHGLITTQDIGVDPSGENLTAGLSCSTTYNKCCFDFPSQTESSMYGRTRSGNGSWLYPNKPNHPYVVRQEDQPEYIYGIRRHDSAVYVIRNKENRPNHEIFEEDGIWRCIIYDSSGIERTKFIGVYSNETSNGTLSIGKSSNIQFTMVSEHPMIFNLTFRTTGGPATYVTWSRNGANISSSTQNSRFSTSQTVIDNNGYYTAGDYINTLMITGRLAGMYRVSVTNDKTTIPVTSTSVSIIDFLSISTALSPDLRNIIISWKLSASLSILELLTGQCEVRYTVCPKGGGDCSTTFTSVNLTDTQYTVTNVLLWAKYNFTITSHHLISSVNQSLYLLPGSIHSHTITTDGILAPEIYSVIKLANITSVQVTWNQPKGGLMVDEYVVSYMRLKGRDGECSSFQDSNNVTLDSKELGEAATHTTTLHLHANSAYVVNVTGKIRGALQNTSNSFQFETDSSIPSRGPQNLTIINSTSTRVTLSWDSVDCLYRNGLITQYLVIIESCDDNHEVAIAALLDNNEMDNGGRYVATELQPSISYLFRVAAINRNGVGPFTEVKTTHGTCGERIRSGHATITGMAIVIALLVLIITAISIALITISYRVYRFRVRPKGRGQAKNEMEIRLTECSAEEGDYAQPTLPSSHYSLEMVSCAAYEAAKN